MGAISHSNVASSLLEELSDAPLDSLAINLLSKPSIPRAVTLLLSGISENFLAETECESLSKDEFISLREQTFTNNTTLRVGDVTYLPAEGRATILADIEGDLRTLLMLLYKGDLLERLKDPSRSEHLIFLGDFIDRSTTSLAFLEFILVLRRQFPHQIHILPGNHELSPGVQHKLGGFFREIEEADMSVSKEDWKYLRWCSWFNDYIRGVTGPFDDTFWVYDSEQRLAPRRAILEKLKIERAKSSTMLPDEEPEKHTELCDVEFHTSEALSLRNRYRVRVSKLYLWELAQTYFFSLPKLVVGESFVATHGLPPLIPDNELAAVQDSPEVFFQAIAKTCKLPDETRRNTYNSMVWSDIHPPDAEKDPFPLPVQFNTTRREGYLMTAEVVQKFLKATGRTCLLRGHQHFLNPANHLIGSESDGWIYTINSSRQHPLCTAGSINFNRSGITVDVIDLHQYFKRST